MPPIVEEPIPHTIGQAGLAQARGVLARAVQRAASDSA